MVAYWDTEALFTHDMIYFKILSTQPRLYNVSLHTQERKNDPTGSTRHAGLVVGDSPLRKQYVKHQTRTFWSSRENFSPDKMLQNDRTQHSEVVNLKLDLKLETNWSSTVAALGACSLEETKTSNLKGNCFPKPSDAYGHEALIKLSHV